MGPNRLHDEEVEVHHKTDRDNKAANKDEHCKQPKDYKNNKKALFQLSNHNESYELYGFCFVID